MATFSFRTQVAPATCCKVHDLEQLCIPSSPGAPYRSDVSLDQGGGVMHLPGRLGISRVVTYRSSEWDVEWLWSRWSLPAPHGRAMGGVRFGS